MKLSLLKSKTLVLCMYLVAGIAFTSCSNSDDSASEGGGNSDKNLADYTVIMLMQGGEVDSYAVYDLAQTIDLREQGKIGDNVNLVGLVKPTKGFAYKEQRGCFLVDLKPKQGLPDDTIKNLRSLDYHTDNPYKCAEGWRHVLKNMDTKLHCDTATNINTSDTIASFIKQAVALHPAKHYVLMLYGHGSGYCSAYEPTVEAAHTETRACLPDVNLQDGLHPLSLDEFMLGVQKSGVKLQTLFTHCCLMASLENMTAYATQFDYYLGSAETTTGHYIFRFLQELSQAGDDEAKLKEGLKNTVDYYADFCNENSEHMFPTSVGYYDLKKMPELLSTVKEAKDWFVEANAKDTIFMRNVLFDTYYTDDADNAMLTKYDKRQEYKDMILHPEKHADDITQDVLYEMISAFLQENNDQEVKYGFIFASMLKAAIDNKSLCTANLDFDKLQNIYDKYMSEIKDMAYIACTKEDEPEMCDAYLYCSPSVQLVGFNENYFTPLLCLDELYFMDLEKFKNNLSETLYNILKSGDENMYEEVFKYLYNGNYFANKYLDAKNKNNEERMKMFDVHNVSDTYCATLFHQKTGWGDLLKQTVYNPNWFFNPVR